MNILYIGTFSGPSGYAVAARGYFELLVNEPQINLKIVNNTRGAYGEEPEDLKDYVLKAGEGIFEDYIVLYFVEPGDLGLWSIRRWSGIDVEKMLKGASSSLAIVAWEAKGVPLEWVNFISSHFSGLIVSSKFQNQNFSSELENFPVYTIPYVVKALPPAPVASPKFRILCISQWSFRKGFDILIQAFLCEFFDNTDTELTIKTFGREGLPKEKDQITRAIQDYKANCSRHLQPPKCQIKLWCGGIAYRAIGELYDNCDLFALATRGEGFGLTIAEAIDKGKRVLVPDKGGHMDYTHPNNYLVKSRVETMRCSTWSPSCSSEFKLIEPDFEDTRAKLRQAYDDFRNNKQEWINKQKESTIFTKDYLSEDMIKEQLLDVLKNETENAK